MPTFLRTIAFFSLLLPLAVKAQHVVHGTVVDDATLEPLAFVHVLADGEREGTTTGIDGHFRLAIGNADALLRFSYVGYAPLAITADEGEAMLVRMKRTAHELKTVEVLPGENPAHRIINNVRANRKQNDGMHERSHRYRSYSKTIFTAALDSAILNDPDKLAALDSNDREAVDWLDRQHLLMIESATRRSFIPPAAEKEEVLAMRVSGLKDPSLLALAASTKTFSVYAPQIDLYERSYLGPIGPASTDRYLFLLQDTLYQGNDSVFVISFQPRRGKKFDALKGVLYVNTDGYALQSVIAEPVERAGGVSMKLQQQFQKIDGKAWFPVQLNTFLYLDFVNVGQWKAIGIGRTYLEDIEVDVEVERKEVRGPELVMEKEAVRKDEELWSALRIAPLDQRELRTYHTMDSLGEEFGLDRKVKWLSIVATGRLPIGPVDFHLRHLFAYNGHEGARVGAGLSTNDKVSRYFSIGGYAAYGFADEAAKYGGDLTIKPRPGREFRLRGYFANDVEESGGVEFMEHRTLFSNEGQRMWFVDRMHQVRRIGGEAVFRVNSSLKLRLGSEWAERSDLQGYRFAERLTEQVTLHKSRFITGDVRLGLRFAFREQVMRLPDRQVALGTKWPVLYVQLSRSMEGLWQGEEEIWRASAMVERAFKLRMLGTLSVRAMGGMADPRSPYPFLFNLRGTFDRDLPFSVENTFEAMLPNEFLADRYASLHLRHSFGNLLFKGRKWRPVPILVGAAAWGILDHPELHSGYGFRSLGSGYYEAGLQIDNILRSGFTGMGVGVYTRLGEHASADPMEDVAIKLTMALQL